MHVSLSYHSYNFFLLYEFRSDLFGIIFVTYKRSPWAPKGPKGPDPSVRLPVDARSLVSLVTPRLIIAPSTIKCRKVWNGSSSIVVAAVVTFSIVAVLTFWAIPFTPVRHLWGKRTGFGLTIV